jgi:signal transduction histidine kinase
MNSSFLRTFFRSFDTIGWKLAASYAVVTVLATFLIEIVLLGLLVLGVLSTGLVQELVANTSRSLAQSMEDVYRTPEPDPDQLGAALQTILAQEGDEREPVGLQGRTAFPTTLQEAIERNAVSTAASPDEPMAWRVPVVVLLDAEGRVLTATLNSAYPQGAPLAELDVPAARNVVDAAMRGSTATDQIAHWDAPYGHSLAAAPVRGTAGDVVGVVYTRFPRLPVNNYVLGALYLISLTALLIVPVSAVLGLIFGTVAGRGFSRRLMRLTGASADVARGDLSQHVEDRSLDEIGQLTREFNTMTRQLNENMRTLRKLAERNTQLAEQAAHLATIEERNRLARDLHDSVSQDLFSLTMLAAAARQLMQQDPALAAKQLENIEATAQHALKELRGLIFALRPLSLEDRGLAQAVHDLVQGVNERQSMQVTLSVRGKRPLPLEQEQTLFRIAQEALANVVRHSGVREARVDLCYERHQTILTISDEGRGFDPQRAPRHGQAVGLDSMAERARSLGGVCHIVSTPGGGTRIETHLPYPGIASVVAPDSRMAALVAGLPQPSDEA